MRFIGISLQHEKGGTMWNPAPSAVTYHTLPAVHRFETWMHILLPVS